jgi:hypothetical protein
MSAMRDIAPTRGSRSARSDGLGFNQHLHDHAPSKFDATEISSGLEEYRGSAHISSRIDAGRAIVVFD